MKTKTMGAMIAQRRKEMGMTQLELANKMGVTDKAVSKWERNLSCPDIHSFPRLAEILHVSIEELMQSGTGAPVEKSMSEMVRVALKGIALAMGIAVVVLSGPRETGRKNRNGPAWPGAGKPCNVFFAG